MKIKLELDNNEIKAALVKTISEKLKGETIDPALIKLSINNDQAKAVYEK